ncbi:MAG TPA: hypothetical protein VGX48_17745 [Pyrinomonadaceae bacterium]|nr:hypothetical protein [Pyrinomonadaceae bacterium]
MITLKQFRQLFPACPGDKAALYQPLLVAAMAEFGIVTRKRAAAFLAQLAHESNDLSRWSENLNYSARRLTQVWPRRFPTPAAAEPYAHNPQALANKTYGGRMGNTQPGDGWKFRGRCPIQATGREMYELLADLLGLPLLEDPDLLLAPRHGFRAAAAIWARVKGLNSVADKLNGRGDEADLRQLVKITVKINGGTNGKEDREARYRDALKVLTVSQFAEAQLQHTLDSLTAPEAPAATPQAVPTSEAQPQAPQAPAAATEKTPAEPSLLDEIPVNDETKAVGAGLARKLGLRAGGGIVTLWTMGLGGKVFLIAALLGAAGLVYYYRREVRAALVLALRKVKGGA